MPRSSSTTLILSNWQHTNELTDAEVINWAEGVVSNNNGDKWEVFDRWTIEQWVRTKLGISTDVLERADIHINWRDTLAWTLFVTDSTEFFALSFDVLDDTLNDTHILMEASNLGDTARQALPAFIRKELDTWVYEWPSNLHIYLLNPLEDSDTESEPAAEPAALNAAPPPELPCPAEPIA